MESALGEGWAGIPTMCWMFDINLSCIIVNSLWVNAIHFADGEAEIQKWPH
jgi:hypothetical protein